MFMATHNYLCRSRKLAALLAQLALAVASAAPANAGAIYRPGDTITGPVLQVIDGDTLAMRHGADQVHVRLHGVDAPEHDQQCRDAKGAAYNCGRSATMHLVQLIGGTVAPCPSTRQHGACLSGSRPVRCEVRDLDRRYGRPVAICTTGGTDLSFAQVSAGWAAPYSRYSHDYDAIGTVARLQARGIWAGPHDDPADWRKRQQASR